MRQFAYVDIACNDPDNGNFAGRTHMITYNFNDKEYVELEADNWEGYAFTEIEGGIRLHRNIFSVVASKAWIGNWCWNRYKLPRPQAKKLIATLRDSGRWRCTHGPTRWFDWFNREGAFLPPAQQASPDNNEHAR